MVANAGGRAIEAAAPARRSDREKLRRACAARELRQRKSDLSRAAARHPARDSEFSVLRDRNPPSEVGGAHDGRGGAELHAAPAARRRRTHFALESAFVSVVV